MMFRIITVIFLFFMLCSSLPNANAAEDVDWISGKEPLHETGADSPVIGTRWGIATRKNDIQITFKLETTTDMKQGSWGGDIRAPEKFYVKIYLLGSNGEQYYYRPKGVKAIGPDAENGRWKDGAATTDQQTMLFKLKWDDMELFRKYKTLVLKYAHHDKPAAYTDINIPLENFAARLGEIETSIKNTPGGARFVMTSEEIDTTPMKDLPASIREYWQDDLKRIASDVSMPLSELHKLSMKEIRKLLKDNAKDIRAAKLARTKKAHQAIYDQRPKWLDINVCPKPDVRYCNNVGKTAYRDDTMSVVDGKKFPVAMTVNYGKIFGVIWRSEGSIIEISRGDVVFDRDPIIYRAPKAEYYYIIKEGDYIKVKPSADIYAQG